MSVELEDNINGFGDGSGSGGGDIGTGAYNVKVIDYDGTIIAEKNLNEGDTFKLPKAPSHDGLVFQEWSSTQDIADGKITVGKSDVMIGAIYTTASGKNEFDIELTTVTGLSVTLNIDGTKDWGDGTTDSLTSHTYSQVGKYTIKCDGTTMTTDSTTGVFGQTSSLKNYYCKAIRLSTITTLTQRAFFHCYSLKNVSLPKEVSSYGQSVFYYCVGLNSIIFPTTTTLIQENLLNGCYTLRFLVIPNTVTLLYGSFLQLCYTLTSLSFNKISVINSNVFVSCYSILEYDFSRATIVPVLGGGAFTNINGLCKIKVPSALYDSWITATNWVVYADYIVKV